MTATFCDCGHVAIADGIGTGYALNRHDQLICYRCADNLTRSNIAAAQPGVRATLYVSSNGQLITTWSGGYAMRITGWGKRHNWSRDRRYLSAVDHTGCYWHGTGAPGEWASLKKAAQ